MHVFTDRDYRSRFRLIAAILYKGPRESPVHTPYSGRSQKPKKAGPTRDSRRSEGSTLTRTASAAYAIHEKDTSFICVEVSASFRSEANFRSVAGQATSEIVVQYILQLLQ